MTPKEVKMSSLLRLAYTKLSKGTESDNQYALLLLRRVIRRAWPTMPLTTEE